MCEVRPLTIAAAHETRDEVQDSGTKARYQTWLSIASGSRRCLRGLCKNSSCSTHLNDCLDVVSLRKHVEGGN